MKQAAELYPQAARYQDYRKLFDQEHKNIDAVMVGTPDHHHYPATMIALQLGKHVYTQKPLTHTPWEARQLTEAARKYKVATQMGNQGHAGEGWRRVYGWIHSGALGHMTEVHTWTDRPIWPQGLNRPEEEDPVPAHLDWDVWLGPAPPRCVRTRKRPITRSIGAAGGISGRGRSATWPATPWTVCSGPSIQAIPRRSNPARQRR
ncbi:MAG: Gfo/Idh/MocA family oxidoreductase [Phycisphaerae bacterium]|nr:Gfo/Idh/MocA family oxidoreductase [Phycisphaerae bacterium]